MTYESYKEAQAQFALGQYKLACKELGIDPSFDAGGKTLIEAIRQLKGEKQTLETNKDSHA